MKKLLCLLLAMTMLMGSLFVLSACDKKDKKEEATTEEKKDVFKLPEGYALYENDYISFAYPAEWTKTDLGEDAGAMIMDGSTGNNITAVGEEYSDTYKTMTVEEFNKTVKPQLTASGLSVSNVKIEQIKGADDLAITKISYNVKSSGVTMKQYVYVVPSGDRNYAVSVTEVKAVDGLLDTLVASFVAKK